MPTITVRGTEHYYEWVTAADTAQPTGRPVLVFIHGWGGSARYWNSTAQALSDRCDCLLYDLRGFGRSSSSAVPGYELESYADDLAILLDEVKLTQPIYLNAHSMGASIGLYFVNRYPKWVSRIILNCSGIFEYDEQAFAGFYRFGSYVVKFRPRWLKQIPYANRLFMARFLHRPLPDSDSRAFLEDFLAADYQAALATIFASVSKRATEVMPQEFSKLSVDTLMISGQYDQIISAKMAQQAAQLNPRIQFVEIPATGHFPMLEDPQTYLDYVQNFLGLSQR